MKKEALETYLKLLEEVLNQFDFLDSHQKNMVMDISRKFSENLLFFHQCNQCIVDQNGAVDAGENIAFQANGDQCRLAMESKEIVFPSGQMRTIIAAIVDVLDPILPMGSVVDMKKDMFSSIEKLDTVENFRIVLTNRFLYYEEIPVYFPYAGTIYPVGNSKYPAILHFTPGAIERIVFRGFADGADDAYIFEQKKELILERNMHSVNFASKEEIETLSKRMKEN